MEFYDVFRQTTSEGNLKGGLVTLINRSVIRTKINSIENK